MSVESQNNKTRGQGINPNEFIKEREPYTQFQTWLADTKGVIGCPTDCQYCFLKLDGKTPSKPQINLSPEEMIKQLPKSHTYHSNIPINFGSETDIFATKQNINYYYELLERFNRSNYENPVILITKKHVPDKFIELISRIQKKIILYISYSGLGGTKIEPHVSSEEIRDNFIRLNQKKIPVVHYWRPFLPQNSTIKDFHKILSHVSNYAKCSVVNGLRLNDGIRENLKPFWPELYKVNYDFSKTGEFWPKGVRSSLIDLSKEYKNYPIFFGNTPCSVAYTTNESDIYGTYNGEMCLESQCPPVQRNKCKNNYQMPTPDKVRQTLTEIEIKNNFILTNSKIIIKGNIGADELTYTRTRLKFPVIPENICYRSGYNWSQIQEENRIIEVEWNDHQNLIQN
ncbi:MAG: hypothetical protein PHX34_05505 [Candidatus Shapirobacteria bacterium]|nr:hypothetical protein [Candidatus Shapirobacteria bacterium]